MKGVPFSTRVQVRRAPDRNSIERRYLDQVEAELGRLRDRALAFVVAPAPDPDECMDTELVHCSTPRCDGVLNPILFRYESSVSDRGADGAIRHDGGR